MLLFFLVIIFFICLLLTYKVIKYFLLSPVYLYILFTSISIITTYLYHFFYEDKFSLFGLDMVSDTSFLNVMNMYLISFISFLLGVLVYYDFSTKKTKLILNKSFTENLFLSYKTPKTLNKVAIGLSIVIVFLYFLAYEKGIFIRDEYLPDVSKTIKTLAKILTFIDFTILGLIYHQEKKIARILFLVLSLISFSTGSRSTFVYYLVFSCLLYITGNNNIYNKIRFSLHIILSFIFLAFIMKLRTLKSHGLIPYAESVLAVSKEELLKNIMFNVYYSFIYGVYVTIETLKQAKIDWNIIIINLNPMTGSMAGWYDHFSKMRINPYVPYSLHGRVFKTGIPFSFFYFFMTGVIFSFFEKKIRLLLSKNKRISSFLIVIMLLLYIIYAFEYNMRSAVRFFYYSLFILFIAYLYKQIKDNLPKK